MPLAQAALRYLAAASALLALWLVLAGGFARDELLLGGLVSLSLAALALWNTRRPERCLLHPRRIYHAGLLLPSLLIAIVKSNLDVAWRILQPQVAIRPGIVRARTRLRSPWGRLALTSCITLTPGTLSVETSGEDLFVHWIDVRSGDIEGATRAIVQSFERHLEVIFG